MTTSSPPSSSDAGASAAFARLHEGVRRWVWDQGWTALRSIQERAVEPVLRGDTDVIISAPTAGGKTEAAFLPIASRLAQDERRGLGCICISPLKALINDQSSRLAPLFERVDLPLTPWHGDVAQGRKQRLLREPRGLLLITPESLEALFVLRGTQLPQLLQPLRYVVVDELHSFIGRERGRQLQSLLNRVELAVRRRIPRIALSATLGDMPLAAEALRPRGGSGVLLIEGERDGRELLMQLRGYRARPPDSAGTACPEPPVGRSAERVPEDLFDLLRGRGHLIFANSRERVEELTDRLRRLSEDRRVPSEFLAHHGNLSREIREDAEQRVKDSTRPTSIVCTSTLELGVDIGNVASIAQVGSPPSVAALRQRLGRSGRRGDAPAVLRLFIVEEEIDRSSNLMDELRAQLVQSIAMIELLVDRWCEPPAKGQLHISTLIQQILSVLAQHGGAAAQDLYRALCQSGPFEGIDAQLFARLLRCLGERHLVTQTSGGALTLGERGEQLVDHYSFYAAFVSPEEYRLVAGAQTLGTVPVHHPLAPGSPLIFAGRRWEVLRVDDEARVIELQPARGGRPPRFEGGGFDIHDRVRNEMLQTYTSSFIPRYLDTTAHHLLSEARSCFGRLRLAESPLVERGGTFYLFPWRGDRVLHTLSLQLVARDIGAATEGIAIAVRGANLDQLEATLAQIAGGAGPSGAQLAGYAQNQIEEKYDWALSSELRCIDYASRHFDEAGAREAASRLISIIRRHRRSSA